MWIRSWEIISSLSIKKKKNKFENKKRIFHKKKLNFCENFKILWKMTEDNSAKPQNDSKVGIDDALVQKIIKQVEVRSFTFKKSCLETPLPKFLFV